MVRDALYSAPTNPMNTGDIVTLNLAVGPVVSLIAGVLILIVPRLLNFIVAIYLIIIGLIGIFGWSGTRIHQTAIDDGRVMTAPSLVAATVPVPLRISRSNVPGSD
jgi:hypothetical protein